MTARRITPTARLVLPVGASKEEWLAVRRAGITATDLPGILGLSEYKTAIDVWTDKVSPSDEPFIMEIGEGEAALWGTVLEDTVARTWAEHYGVTVRRIGVIAHDKQPWIRASLDRIVNGCPDGRCGVEVKTRSGYVSEKWDAGVPADVAAQVDWQLITSGLDHMHVIALIGGQRLVHHIQQPPTPEKRDEMIANARIVWDAVATGEAPRLPEAVWTDAYLEQLHPDHSGEVEIPVDVAAMVEDYNSLITIIKDLEAEKAEMRTRLIGAIGDAETATCSGRLVYTYKASTRKTLDTSKLTEIYTIDLNDDRLYKTTTTRTLRTSQKGDK